jgi:hypothetical protein
MLNIDLGASLGLLGDVLRSRLACLTIIAQMRNGMAHPLVRFWLVGCSKNFGGIDLAGHVTGLTFGVNVVGLLFFDRTLTVKGNVGGALGEPSDSAIAYIAYRAIRRWQCHLI